MLTPASKGGGDQGRRVLVAVSGEKGRAQWERLLREAHPDMDVERIRSISPFPEEEIFKCMLEVRRDIDRRHQLRKEDFPGFWEKIDE